METKDVLSQIDALSCKVLDVESDIDELLADMNGIPLLSEEVTNAVEVAKEYLRGASYKLMTVEG